MKTQQPKPGMRIQCVRMGDDPDPIPSGSKGTVLRTQQHNFGQGEETHVSVAWDSGRTLTLVGPVDTWTLLTAEKV